MDDRGINVTFPKTGKTPLHSGKHACVVHPASYLDSDIGGTSQAGE